MECIKAENWEVAGNLLYQSHEGLKELYQVSCPELDFLVELSTKEEEIYGSRMMGGGFGGCTINISANDNLDQIKERWTKSYQEKFGLTPEFYSFTISNGTSIIN